MDIILKGGKKEVTPNQNKITGLSIVIQVLLLI